MENNNAKDLASTQLSPLGREYPINQELQQWAQNADNLALPKTIPQLFEHSVLNYPNRPYLAARVEGKYVSETYVEIYEKIKNFASALLELGFKPGDRVANFSNNRPEWPVVDFGCAYSGCVHVPMYATLSQAEMAHIVKDSGARLVVCATNDHLVKVLGIAGECPELEHIVAINPSHLSPDKKLWSWEDFLAMGQSLRSKHNDRIDFVVKHLKPWDVSSIVYTSGTTGSPKGAMLMHGNFCSQATSLVPNIQATCEDCALSFLPLAHVFERIFYYIMTYVGASISYANGIHTLFTDILDVQPTLLPSVPVLFGKVYDRMLEKVGASPSMPYAWALKVGRSYRQAQRAGRVSRFLRAKQAMVRRTVFADLHRRTGKRIRYFISGGAPLRREVGEFFWDVGLPILEGYGLTETAPVITLNPSNAPRFGSVGQAITNVEVVLDQDGEILARGPNMMRGYYKRPEDTAAVFDSRGWFHTGDIGQIEDGYVTITDRKKELIVLSNGKNVAPSIIEQTLVTSPFIERAVVVGHNRPYVSALIVPNSEKLLEWAKNEGLGEQMSELVNNEKVKAHYQMVIRDVCKDLSNYEKVKRMVLLPEDLSVAKGELTHSMKIKHRVVEERFAATIESLYV